MASAAPGPGRYVSYMMVPGVQQLLLLLYSPLKSRSEPRLIPDAAQGGGGLTDRPAGATSKGRARSVTLRDEVAFDGAAVQ